MTATKVNVQVAPLAMPTPTARWKLWSVELNGLRQVTKVSPASVFTTVTSQPLATYESHAGLPVSPVVVSGQVWLVAVLPVA